MCYLCSDPTNMYKLVVFVVLLKLIGPGRIVVRCCTAKLSAIILISF